jgi:small ligand-binding sensory domain FIST
MSDVKIKIATGEKFGATAKTEYIVDAIQSALTKANLKSASSVLLFLTNGYTQDPRPALKAAAKTAGTIQVFGATATGLFTENNWLLDDEGAVAMVFPEECDLQPVNLLKANQKFDENLPLVCLTSPEQSKIAINHYPHHMNGAVTSNSYGASEYPIWQASRIAKTGFLHAGFNFTSENDGKTNSKLIAHTVISQGTRRISSNLKLDDVKDNRIFKVNRKAAISSLKETIPENIYSMFLEQPYHTLCAVSEASDDSALNALNKDFYKLFNIVGVDNDDNSIYLSGKVKTNQHCFWALRDRAIAEKEIENKLNHLSKKAENPCFAILFCSESRGPYFYGKDKDMDLELFKQYFPNTPLIGIYSSGEISAGSHYDALLRRYSSVLTVFEKTKV